MLAGMDLVKTTFVYPSHNCPADQCAPLSGMHVRMCVHMNVNVTVTVTVTVKVNVNVNVKVIFFEMRI